MSTVQEMVQRAVAASAATPERRHLRLELLTLSDLAHMAPVTPLVEGMLYRDTLAQLAGAPGSYKSFIALGVACAIAAGERQWEGHRIPVGGPVVYVAPEGASGLRVRIFAWCESNDVAPERLESNLRILEVPIQLGDAMDVSDACDIARELSAVLLVLDTRARCTVGLSENDATDQGRAIAAAELIQRAAGCTVLGIHHSGRSGDHGRGSNAWDGALWSDLRLEGGDLRAKMRCAKHKDVPDGCEHHYRLLPRVVSEAAMPRWLDSKGSPVGDVDYLNARSTLVAVQNGNLDVPVDGTRTTRAVLDIIRTSAGAEGLTRAQLVPLAEEKNVSRSATYTAVNVLVSGGALVNIGRGQAHKYVLAGAPEADPQAA